MTEQQRKLCRCFLREFRRLGPSFEPAPPAAFPLWGKAFRGERASHPELRNHTPATLKVESKQPFMPWARNLLRDELRWNPKGKESLAVLLAGNGDTDAALEFLRHQSALPACTSKAEEGGVRVDAVSGFVETKSDEQASKYVFTYNVSFTNTGTQRLRILGRQYEFRNAGGAITKQISPEQPEAAGLIGLTPILEPGDKFGFGSGTVLRSPQGSLTGGFLVAVEPEGLSGEDAQLHAKMEDQELMLRLAYFKGLGTEMFHLPLGQLNFDASVPCVAAS
jgi:ApaG protein